MVNKNVYLLSKNTVLYCKTSPIFLQDISKRLNGLEFYRGFLYVADLNRPTIFRVRVSDVLTAGVNSSVTAIPFGPSFFTVTGIKVVFDSAPSSSGKFSTFSSFE